METTLSASNGRLASDRLLRLLVWKVPGNLLAITLPFSIGWVGGYFRQALGSRAETTQARKTGMEGE